MRIFGIVLSIAALSTGIPAYASQSPKPVAAESQLVCAATMQALFFKPYVFVKNYNVDGRTVHQFKNPHNEYACACYVDGSSVMWRTDASPSHIAPGRWRNHPAEEKITWSKSSKAISIKLNHADGSVSASSYPKSRLLKLIF